MGQALSKPASVRGRPRDLALTSRRRAQIVAAAETAFATRGYRAADLQRLADSLGISKGTVYRYFPTKRQLFLATLENAITQLNQRINTEALRAGDPLRRVRRAVHAYLRFFERRPEVVELIIQERAEFKQRREPTYFAHRRGSVITWQRIWAGLIAAGRVRDIPVETITDVIGNALYGAILTNYFAGRKTTSARQASNILDVVFKGLLACDCRERKGDPT